MMELFNRLGLKISQYYEGLSENKPNIEWVKAVENYRSVAFAAQYSTALAGKIASADIIMKAEDGRFFVRHKWDKKPVWHGEIDGEKKTFRSPYLDGILADALAKGLKTQPSAHDIFSSTMGLGSRRLFIIFNGSDEQFKNLDRDHPRCPSGFSDYNVPEDYDQTHPHFANYMRKKGYVPFRLNAQNEGQQATPQRNLD